MESDSIKTGINAKFKYRQNSPVKIITWGIFWLIYLVFVYMVLNLSQYLIGLAFPFLILIITGIFEIREYYNKIVYFMLITSILTVTLILSVIQTSPQNMSETPLLIPYYVIVGLLVLYFIWYAYKSPQRWNNYQNTMKPYDEVLTANPNDTAALNNKGVELAIWGKYNKAMDYFNKVLEIDSKDPVASHNKKFVDKKLMYHTVADYLEKTPILEIKSKEGKLILEVKEKKYKESLFKFK